MTTGSAPGHLALFDERSGAQFSGDCLQGSVYLGLDGTAKLCPTSEEPRAGGRLEPARSACPRSLATRVVIFDVGWGSGITTAIDVDVTLTVIPEMWELMERSFSGEDPPFDLIGVDDLLLIQAARSGCVEPIDEPADSCSLEDFPSAAVDALSDGGRVWGVRRWTSWTAWSATRQAGRR